jgi:hypothetical protein
MKYCPRCGRPTATFWNIATKRCVCGLTKRELLTRGEDAIQAEAKLHGRSAPQPIFNLIAQGFSDATGQEISDVNF